MPVHIKSQVTPLLVAYRDGFTDKNGQPVAWTMATPSTSVTFMVKGAYSVAVVCMVNGAPLTWQAFHTLEDDTSDTVEEPTLQTPCNAAAPASRTVHGTTVQAASVHLGNADSDATANTQFTLQVPDGTYDLVATTKNADPSLNKTLIQRNIAISSTSTDLGNNIDVSTGMAQVALGIVLTSPPSADPKKNTEVVTAKVDVKTKNNPGSATVSSAMYDLMNKTIKIFALPKAALGMNDSQTATFLGTDHPKDADGKPIEPMTITFSRSITMPFSIGDDVSTGKTGFALPTKITIPDWGFDKNRLSVALPALPALDDLTIDTSGKTSDGQTTVNYEINITASYFQATALARPVFDTDIPSFQSTWKIDFTKPYSRQIKSQRDVFDEGVFVNHQESVFFEDVNAP